MLGRVVSGAVESMKSSAAPTRSGGHSLHTAEDPGVLFPLGPLLEPIR